MQRTPLQPSQLSAFQLTDYKNVALKLAQAGGNALKEFWGNIKDVQDKGVVGDLVTEADKESEKRILAILRETYPEHEVLAEESGRHATGKSDFLWVVDPLDGTTNYSHKYPIVSVSIALLFCGTPIVGVVYNPIQEELFHASTGQGATLNGEPIYVSATTDLSKSLLASGFPYDRRQNPDNNYAEFCHLTDLTQGVRRGGSAALDLAYVAAGRFDGYWERGVKAWDVAAGVLLVQEAGGRVSNYAGVPLDLYGERILASNAHLHQAISKELTRANCADAHK